jgi:hypothetical protein
VLADFHCVLRLLVMGVIITALWSPALVPAVKTLLRQRQSA